MKYAFFFLFLSVFVMSSCKDDDCEPSGGEFYLYDTISLCIKHSATLQPDGLKITLLDVPTDSRCPTDANCIWWGEAKPVFSFSKAGETLTDTLKMPGMAETPLPADTAAVFSRKVILLDVSPYPGLTPIDKDDYKVKLVVW
jgi:hypothetical protein